ncbi:hypothetical protein HK099_004748 [Clydaea vesicula]|uniref:Uncharacterized protein n=1 Tax=Clydaea vesicula TaxID=447962 RepID=A0AAD5U080_9FUNG|nr:hypothetical protein HK099_004748 [Clydaea vesicula]
MNFAPSPQFVREVKEYIRIQEPIRRDNQLLEANIREFSYEIFFVVDKTHFGDDVRSYWNDILMKLRKNGLQVSVSTYKLWERESELEGWHPILKRKDFT